MVERIFNFIDREAFTDSEKSEENRTAAVSLLMLACGAISAFFGMIAYYPV